MARTENIRQLKTQKSTARRLKKYAWLYVMALPGFAYLITISR